jgi:hypothetical protein
MADTPMGADPVQNQPTPPSGACSPLPSPPASANFGEGDDAKLPPSSNTLMPDVPPLLLGPSDGNKTDREAHLRLLRKLSSQSKEELWTTLPPLAAAALETAEDVPLDSLAESLFTPDIVDLFTQMLHLDGEDSPDAVVELLGSFVNYITTDSTDVIRSKEQTIELYDQDHPWGQEPYVIVDDNYIQRPGRGLTVEAAADLTRLARRNHIIHIFQQITSRSPVAAGGLFNTLGNLLTIANIPPEPIVEGYFHGPRLSKEVHEMRGTYQIKTVTTFLYLTCRASLPPRLDVSAL